MQQHFQTEQWLPYPPELVFAFFANPENLPRLMPRWQHARIEEATFVPPPPRPPTELRNPGVAAGDGTLIVLSFRPLPLVPMRLPWDARIENFRWNEGFCDVQERGPFKYWRHCHTIEAAPSPEGGRPGAIVRDSVRYEFAFGSLNLLFDKLLVRRMIERAFRFRHRRTQEMMALIARHAA